MPLRNNVSQSGGCNKQYPCWHSGDTDAEGLGKSYYCENVPRFTHTNILPQTQWLSALGMTTPDCTRLQSGAVLFAARQAVFPQMQRTGGQHPRQAPHGSGGRSLRRGRSADSACMQPAQQM